MGGAETGGTSSGRGPGRFERGDNVVGNAAAEDEPLEQAVRSQPIGAVEARAGHLAGRPEAVHRRPAVRIDRHPADHVMSTGADRNPVARDVEVEVAAEPVDSRKPLANPFRVEVRKVEVHVRVLGLRHLSGDRQRNYVPGRQFRQGMKRRHESLAVRRRADRRLPRAGLRSRDGGSSRRCKAPSDETA